MKVQCPVCKSPQEVPSEYISRQVKCQSCNHTFSPQQNLSVVSSPQETKLHLPKNSPPSRRDPRVISSRAFLFIILTIVPAASVLSFYCGYVYGHKRGWNKGFWKGGDTVVDIAKALSENQPPPVPAKNSLYDLPMAAFSEPARFHPGNIISSGWKKLNTMNGVWFVSWQVKFHSLITAHIDVEFCFYDSDGYLLHTSLLYDQSVEEGRSYTFTSDDMLMAGLGPRIASSDAKVIVR